MNTISKDQKEKLLLQQLQEILLTGDRANIQQLQDTLDSYDLLSEKVSPIIQEHLLTFRNNFPQQFREIVNGLIETRAKKVEQEIFLINALINDKDLLSDKISPIVQDHIDHLIQHFPKEFKTVVDKQIEKKLRDSQEEILNVITPVLGKLIRKSITHQFQVLKENIDKKIKATFSKQGLFGKIFGFKSKDAEEILSEIDQTIIEEVYVIQRDSGLLMGSASLETTMDQDMIAGMFTAIKAFVEDAFKREKEELEMIEYGNYKIFIQNFYAFYVAVAISGSISALEKDEISTKLYDFAELELKSIPKDIDDTLNYRISGKLREYFFDPKHELKDTQPDD
ncbi:MAG: hypothetical protein ACI8VT_002144 [Saprospiraceae bacterium]|jgi:hypothetical protein